MNDWYTAAFVMVALWLVVRGAPSMPALLAAGALVGAGAGFKLTGAVYGLGLLAAVAVFDGPWRSRMHRVVTAGAAMAAGFALTAGPWMALMAERYGNPLFPYYNDIFRSPWADPVSFSATRFGPTSLRRMARLSLRDAVEGQGLRIRGRVPRCAPGVALRAGADGVLLRIVRRPVARPAVPAIRSRSGASSACSSWCRSSRGRSMYRIFRYLVPLELLGGAFIAYFVVRLVPARRARAGARRGVRAGGGHRQVSDLVARNGSATISWP